MCVWAFNQPIGTWNTTSVTTMDWLFSEGYRFDHQLDGWHVSSGKAMVRLFQYPFSQPLSTSLVGRA
jgi:surface protein